MNPISRRMSIVVLAVGCTLAALVVTAGGAQSIPNPGVLVYEKLAANGVALFTANLDGTSPVSRVPGGEEPVVSPDGTKIAYVSGTDFSLYVSSIAGTGRVHLTDGVDGGMSWSPDGTKLIASSYSDGLAVITVSPLSFTPISGSEHELLPQWSPDGTLIASIAPNGHDQVLRRPSGLSRVVRVNTPTGPWSPDGRNMLEINADTNCLCAYNVITGARQTIGFAQPDLFYLGGAWKDWSDGSMAAYFGIDNEPVSGPQSIQVRLISGGSTLDPNAGTSTLIAANAIFPSTGGFTVSDSNGGPAAVANLASSATPSYVHLSWDAPAATPDFAGVEIRYALGSTPPATVTDGVDGGRLLTASRVLGPFGPDQPVAVSVFSRDWSGNIGLAATAVLTTPHDSATTMSTHAAPFDLVYGQRATLTATLTRDFDQAPIANATVSVARRRWGTSDPFIPLGSMQTNSAGVASFTQIPSASWDYQFTYAGDTTHAATTALSRLRVAHRVSISVDHASAPAGSTVHITAATAPRLKGGATYLQKFTTRFVNVGPHPTNSVGTVVYTVRAPARGTTVKYRVLVPGGQGYINGYSAAVTITGR